MASTPYFAPIGTPQCFAIAPPRPGLSVPDRLQFLPSSAEFSADAHDYRPSALNQLIPSDANQ